MLAAITTLLLATSSIGLDEDPELREYAGVRSLAMGGAHRAVGTSNDAITLNPAGMAMSSRYSIDAAYSHGLTGVPNHFHFSIVDSKTSAAAGGLSYTLSRMNEFTNHRVYLSSAYKITSMLSLGTTMKYVHGEFSDKDGNLISRDYFATDLGFSLIPSSNFALGLTFHNLVRSDTNPFSTHRMGLAAALTYGPLLVAFDAVTNGWEFKPEDITYHTGIELFLFGMIAIRMGHTVAWAPQEDEIERQPQHKIAAGLGFVDEIGAIDMTYRQSINGPMERELLTTLKIFL